MGGQRPFGNFLKIHAFCRAEASLTALLLSVNKEQACKITPPKGNFVSRGIFENLTFPNATCFFVALSKMHFQPQEN